MHSGIRTRIRLTLLGSALLAAPSLRAEALDDVVVTATRVPQPIDQIIGAVDVITREEIEQLQPQSLQELLRQQTGIDLTSQGGLGKLTAMFIRGTENEHVLVLIDGVRAGSISSGTTPFEYLPVDQVERIEIVRGPRSSLYGSDAIGGVIQIFTRKGGDRANVRIGGGNFDTFQGNAAFALSLDETTINASFGKQSSQGINACNGSGVTFQGCFTDEPDHDGFSQRSGSLRVAHDAGFATFDLSALFSEGRTEFDGSFQNITEFREFSPSFRAAFDPTKNWKLSLTAGFSRDDQDSFKDGVFRSTFNTERRSASLQNDVTLPRQQLVTLGVDFLDDTIESTTDFDAISRDNTGVFGQYQIGIGTHRLSLSTRHDDNQQFGSHSTGNAGWKWQIAAPIYVMAAWGEAFRAPSFNDLYFPGFSNPNLKPERSNSYEFGVGGIAGASLTWSVNAYRTDIEDLIDLDATFTPANIAKAEIKGIEVEGAATFDKTQVLLSYSYVDPRNQTPGPNYDKILQRRSRHTTLLQVSHTFGPVRLTGVMRDVGERYNNAANTVLLDRYGIIDLFGEWTISDRWSLDAKLANLTDREYSTVYLYNELGFNFLVTAQYKLR